MNFQPGTTATDLVLTVTELLRQRGVVGKFVEFFGPGVAEVSLENRATLGNMSPEYGSTVTIFPVDDETLRYLRFTGRPAELVDLVEAYTKEQGLWHDPDSPPDVLRHGAARPVDGGAVHRRAVPPAGPRPARRRQGRLPRRAPVVDPARRPASRVRPAAAARPPGQPRGGLGPVVPGQRPAVGRRRRQRRRRPRPSGAAAPARATTADRPHAAVTVERDGETFTLDHGHVVIAAITSCTNTSNPTVMLAAGLLAQKAVQRGLSVQPWVKTSLAPGSQVVMDYYEAAGLDRAAGTARLQPRRLRLHHLHRQLRSAAARRGTTPSPTAAWPSPPSCPATATSKAASTPTSA